MDNLIASVDRALEILILLHENECEMGISEIARELNLYKSTVSRTLSTLEYKGFVKKNPENSKYWLGIKLYAMGMMVKEKSVYFDEFVLAANKLFNEFNEVVNISVLDKMEDGTFKSVIVYKKSDPQKVLSANPTLGSYTDPSASSVGKCLLAFNKNITEDYLRKLKLKKFTDNSIVDNELLILELKKIKEQGYSIDDEEREIGLYCIGVPIFDLKGNLVAAISISGPTSRMKAISRSKILSKLKEVSSEIKII